ncbi:Regulator of RpoS [Rubripirellula amarantea]|uniref:Regulator of RpoS n=1 Tax=Rubripirellula amarantea TaxID=2527999 RepID=A0A5C5WK33_9BACT|nr:response regulator [Rubripirellula amarantea]TWT50212.1 Regulator of RpoS [Rubripirellula amarantea]
MADNAAKPTVLVIDDDPIDRAIFQRIESRNHLFRRLDLEPYADDALQKLLNKPDELPEIIIVDLNIPRMSGIEFIDAIEAGLPDRVNDLYVIMLTTSAFGNDRQTVERHDIVKAFMTKPIRLEELQDIIGKFQAWNSTKGSRDI